MPPTRFRSSFEKDVFDGGCDGEDEHRMTSGEIRPMAQPIPSIIFIMSCVTPSSVT
jgi:hypothetical protein